MRFDGHKTCCSQRHVKEAKQNVRAMLQSLEAKIGAVRVKGRYHPEGTRKLEDDYVLTRKSLGAGLSGNVRLAFGRKGRHDVRFAVKSFDLKSLTDVAESCLVSELEIHATVDHPHIVKLEDIYEARCNIHMVMECMQGGQLLDRIIEKRMFKNDEAADVIQQILQPVRYLHEKNIVHCDLKPQNILYSEVGGNHLKLSDFGLSTWWQEGDAVLQAARGTLRFVAPEVLKRAYTRQCDLWSVGVIAFTLLFGHTPFGLPSIKAGDYNLQGCLSQHLSKDAGEFVMALLREDASKRLTARAALEHPWLSRRRCSSMSLDIHSSVIDSLGHFAQASKLQRACCSLACLSSCDTSMDRDFRDFFLEMAMCEPGGVQFEDFQKMLIAASDQANKDDGFLQHVFSALDADSDGVVRYSDFVAAMEISSGHFTGAKVAEIFRRFDNRNSGWITTQDLQDLLSNTCQNDDSFQEFFKALKPSKKGQISFEVFQAHLQGSFQSRSFPSSSCCCSSYDSSWQELQVAERVLWNAQHEGSHILQGWRKRFLSTVDKLIHMQPQQVVDSEALYFEIC